MRSHVRLLAQSISSFFPGWISSVFGFLLQEKIKCLKGSGETMHISNSESLQCVLVDNVLEHGYLIQRHATNRPGHPVKCDTHHYDSCSVRLKTAADLSKRVPSVFWGKPADLISLPTACLQIQAGWIHSHRILLSLTRKIRVIHDCSSRLSHAWILIQTTLNDLWLGGGCLNGDASWLVSRPDSHHFLLPVIIN